MQIEIDRSSLLHTLLIASLVAAAAWWSRNLWITYLPWGERPRHDEEILAAAERVTGTFYDLHYLRQDEWLDNVCTVSTSSWCQALEVVIVPEMWAGILANKVVSSLEEVEAGDVVYRGKQGSISWAFVPVMTVNSAEAVTSETEAMVYVMLHEEEGQWLLDRLYSQTQGEALLASVEEVP